MAPSRRKGANKAASAAAARRQWKVGDLVLAKVKGFPAWPALVSEPENWGFSTDRKKVFVYFFGTQQIAFCNPCDVEAFTEEKKRTLILKRQAKGSDFIRAVEEIFDSYEKSKKQVQVDKFNSGDEGTVANAGNSEGTAGKSCIKGQLQGPLVKPNISSVERDGLSNIVKDPTDTMDMTALNQNLERLSRESADNRLALHHLTRSNSVGTKSSSKRFQDTRLESFIRQQRSSSIQRSKSSTIVDPSKFQNLIMPLSDVNDASGCLISNVTGDESLRRSKRIRKSPHMSACQKVDSPTCSATFLSNGSSENDGSETVATNSDSISLNEGSILDSGCKFENQDIVAEFQKREIELGKKLILQKKGVVTKKKRKPNRKRATNHGAPMGAKPDRVAVLSVDVSKARSNSRNDCGNSNETSYRADDDEHLPLVKRARVRMGKLSTGEEQDNFINTENISSKGILNSHLEAVSTGVRTDGSDPDDRTSLGVEEAVNNSKPLNNCNHFTESGPQFSNFKKHQLCAVSVDAEAALPPSKRLHRALEAMSANAVGDVQAFTEVSSNTGMLTNGCGATSEMRTGCAIMDEGSGVTLETRNLNSIVENTSCDRKYEFSPCVISETPNVAQKTCSEVEACDQFLGISIRTKQDRYKENCVEDGISVDVHVTDLGYPSRDTCIVENEILVSNPQPCLSDIDEKQASLRSSQGSSDQPSPRDVGSNEILESSIKNSNFDLKTGGTYSENDKLHTSFPTVPSPESVSKAEEVPIFSPQGGSDELLPPVDRCGAVNKVAHNPTQHETDASLYPTSRKVLISAGHTELDLPRTCPSDNILSDGDISNASSSPSLIDRVDSVAEVSPSNPFSDISNKPLQHKALPFPHKKTMYQLSLGEGRHVSAATCRQESSDKWKSRAEANVVQKSFESLLGTLSRTKESIGRATRIAIDCAKFGIAGEVVEIIARSLENESSLHRRVDLFFLVDSILQCSHGQIGDIADIYTSAVQAVLPRLLSAAAPPGINAQENRRQCLKVLRLWLERKTLPESIIRHHIQELGFFSDSSSANAFSRRLQRTERAFNDPFREMGGMLVDEYGSNANFQLPGFHMPRMLDDEENASDSDEQSFEAVTPEHHAVVLEEQENKSTSVIEKHPRILEDVDGELEMEDVAPFYDDEMNDTFNVARSDNPHASHDHFDHRTLDSAPPLPADMPPSPPPPPISPLPMVAPPPLLPPHTLSMSYPFNGVLASNLSIDVHNMQNCLPQSVIQWPRTSFNSVASDMTHHYAPECRDLPMQMQGPGSASSVSFGNLPISHSSTQPLNGVQLRDGATLHNKTYHLQPPPPSMSNQFSYVQADKQMHSWRRVSSSYPERFQTLQNMNGQSFYGDRDRMMTLAPHELGPMHLDSSKLSCASVSYFRPTCESTQMTNNGWSCPPRALNCRSHIPSIGPPSEASNLWRPR